MTKHSYTLWHIIFTMTILIGLNNAISTMAMEKQTETQKLLHAIKKSPDQDIQLDEDIQKYINRTIILFKINDFLLAPKTLGAHSGEVCSITTLNEKIMTTSNDTTAIIWNMHDGNLLHTLAEHTHYVTSGAISDDKIVTGSEDDTAKVWNHNGQLLYTLAYPDGHIDTITSVAIGHNKIGTASEDYTAKIWDITNGTLLHTLEGHNDIIYSIAIHNDRLITASWDKTIKIWDIPSGKLILTLEKHSAGIYSMAINENFMVSCSSDNTIHVWDINDYQLLHTFTYDGVVSVAIHNNTLAAGSKDKTAQVWNIQKEKLLRTLVGHTDAVSGIAINNDTVFTSSYDCTAKIWPLSIDFNAPEYNTEGEPLTWIVRNSDIPQADLIQRAYEAKQEKEKFTIYALSEDGKVFLTFTKYIRMYLLKRLNIELEIELNNLEKIRQKLERLKPDIASYLGNLLNTKGSITK